MEKFRVGCANFHGLDSTSKHGQLLNNFRSLNLAIIETRITEKHALVTFLKTTRYTNFMVCRESAALFRKYLGLKVKADFLDPDRRLIVLLASGSQYCAFSLMDVYE